MKTTHIPFPKTYFLEASPKGIPAFIHDHPATSIIAVVLNRYKCECILQVHWMRTTGLDDLLVLPVPPHPTPCPQYPAA